MTAAEHGPAGRWGGRLTRRELPASDPGIESLSWPARERLCRTWLHRAAMERRVADSFEVVAAALRRRGALSSLVALAERAVDDEYRHAELSRLVASRYAGRQLPAPARLPLQVPRHRGASDELRDDLFVVGQCVMNETTASAFLECCLGKAEGVLARAALQELLSDEVEHGRLGWAYLASLGVEARRRIGPWLLPLATTNLRQWRLETPEDPLHPPELAGHGAPGAAVIHEALLEALRGLIVPGCRELGFDVSPLERWLEQGAPT